MKKYLLISLTLCLLSTTQAQEEFTNNPDEAYFQSTDIKAFWNAYDRLESEVNPFVAYIENGSTGLGDFIHYRIESPKNLLKVVKKRATDYTAIREDSYKVENLTPQIRTYYMELKKWVPDAVFPPTYFVIGAFNSGGTSSQNGLIIGVEMQNNIENIPYIVAHELIHFNQHFAPHKNTLLSQSIIEGSADFLGELISGKHINEKTFQYGYKNEEALCKEFVKIMDGSKYRGWLYGSGGKKSGRPNDLGYWIGYQITKAYYDKAKDPKTAIKEILNIQDVKIFLKKSGYLEKYLK